MSLKQVAGGPTPAAIAETRTNAKAAAGVSGKYAVVDGANQASNEFPMVPFAPDSYDDTAMIKTAFADGAAMGGNWNVPFTEADAAYVKRQRDQVENADFDRWVMQKFNLSDPAQLFLFQQIAPEQFQRRMDLIDYEQNLVTKYAKMRLMGPKSMEDLKFEWLIETQRIELPKGPIWDPQLWMAKQFGLAARPTTMEQALDAGLANRQRYVAGMFSPLKYLQEGQTGWSYNAENEADIRGNSAIPIQQQIFTGSEYMNAPILRYGKPDDAFNPLLKQNVVPYDEHVPGLAFGGENLGAYAGVNAHVGANYGRGLAGHQYPAAAGRGGRANGGYVPRAGAPAYFPGGRP